MQNLLTRYIKDESGATAIEYGLIAALIAVAMIVGAKAVGGAINNKFTEVAGDIATSQDYLGRLKISGPLLAARILWDFYKAENVINMQYLTCNIMSKTRMKLVSFLADESGATAVEYALLLGVIALAVLGAAKALGTSLNELFIDTISSEIATS